jgi:hypothetical protein
MKELKTNKRAWLWGLPLLMLCATPACSDDDNDDPNNGSANDPEAVVDLASAPLTINNDQAELASRVRNFTSYGTRAGEDILTVAMDTMPSVPKDAVPWTEQVTGNYYYWDYDEQKTVYVPETVKPNVLVDAGETYTDLETACSGIQFKDGNYYIRGEATLDFHNTYYPLTEANVYVLKGGKLTLKKAIPTNVHVYSWGEVKVDIPTYSDGDRVESVLLNGEYNNPASASLYCTGDLDIGAGAHLNSGTLYVGGALTGGNLHVINGAQAVVNCGSHLTGDVNINSSAINLRGNLKVDGKVVLSSDVRVIYMVSGTVLDANELQLNNTGVAIQIVGDDYAYLKLNTMVSNTTDLLSKLSGPFGIQCSKFLEQNGSETTFQFPASVKLNDELTDITIPSWDDCSGSVEEKVEIPTLETITDVTPSEHTHPISATSIDVANGKIYVSWHWRGVNYHGCVEIGEINNNACQLDQFFETAASETKQKFDDDSKYGRDFNHIMVDTQANRIYVVGNEAKGGLIGYVDLNSNGLVDATQGAAYGILKYRRLLGGDGNCIIRNGDYLQVASTYGYESYSLPNLDRVGRNEQPGKAKFIVKSGNSLYGMHFNSKSYVTTNLQTSADASNAEKLEKIDITLDKFDGYDYLFDGTQTELLTTLEVSPVDGKNVVAVDGNDIYVCCGAYGLVRYSGGTTETFQLPLIDKVLPRGYVNGVTVDANYVYVAYGSAGLYVLNKKDLSVYAKYTNNGGKSCNYVTVPGDGYIYVAYGENGWQVYRLTTIAATVAKK